VEALLPVYARVGPRFVAGEGCELVAEDGTRYLDFVAGIAVNALGYGHPAIRRAMIEALEWGLIHTSNLYRTEPGERLAEWLVERSFAASVFFSNSGGEANEGAFKLARRWARRPDGPHANPGKYEVVAFRGSFHGRLFATLAATDRAAYREPFEPLAPGIQIVPLNDASALDSAITPERTAAVIVEPVQGEGGVRAVAPEVLSDLRDRCDRAGAALIFDEVQCGLGRTGSLFAYEQTGVVPDMLTLAKPLAGGLPMGAILINESISAAIKSGDHATTFGGGPFVASVALAVLETLGQPEFLAAVRHKGERLGKLLRDLKAARPRVREVRGRGLMWGIELNEPVAPFVEAARNKNLLICSAGPTVIRLVPPLVITETELERGVGVLREVLA
jgi:acetylornithine/N-succinyldiaminopimelate aminotransferase